jgi:hypothetical protein
MAQFTGHVNVKDPNAKLDFEGLVRYDQREEVKGLVQIDFIDFEKIGLKDFAGIYASGEIEVDLFSFSLDKIHGFAHANDFTVSRDSASYTFEKLNIEIDRTGPFDEMRIDSDVLVGQIEGVLEFNDIIHAVQHEFAQILPILIKDVDENGYDYKDFAKFDFAVKDANSFLDVIYPDLRVERGTRFSGILNGGTNQFSFNLTSPQVRYQNMIFAGIQLNNNIQESAVNATYSLARYNFNDSLFFEDIQFKASGSNAEFGSVLTWDENENSGGKIQWKTEIIAKDEIHFSINDGHFFIEEQKWSLGNTLELGMSPKIYFRDSKF